MTDSDNHNSGSELTTTSDQWRSDMTDSENHNSGSALTTTSGSGKLTPASDGWDSVPPEPERFIKGKAIRFKEGAYFVNKGEPILPDELMLVVIGVVVAWLRWEDGDAVQHLVTKPGQRHPDRDELGYLDKSKWPIRFAEPDDVWKDTRYMYCVDPKTAEEYTFITDTVGGRRAVGDLRNQIANVRCAHPGAIPLVSLSSEMMPTRKGSPRPKPYFKVVEWRPGKDGGSAPRPDDGGSAPRPDAALPAPKPAKLDDEIPF